MVERLLLGLGVLLADRLGGLGIDVLLELGMRAQQAEIADLGRGHQRQEHVRQPESAKTMPPENASRFQWFKKAVFRYFIGPPSRKHYRLLAAGVGNYKGDGLTVIPRQPD